MLIDFHTHAFPERIAARAVSSLSHSGGGLVPQSEGTAASLLTEMDRDGVTVSVVHSIATNPRQQHSVNTFALELNAHPRLAAFGSVHPDAPDALEELERIAAGGLKGVKFHPEYQHFYVNEERMKPIYRKISELGLPVLFHAGWDIGFPPPYHGMPEQILGALRWLDVPVVAAHWGGFTGGPGNLDILCSENLYFDLSMGYGLIPKPVAQAIVDRHGPERLLFGSDMPWHRPSWELQLLNTLDLSQQDREKICFRNAMALLGLDDLQL